MSTGILPKREGPRREIANTPEPNTRSMVSPKQEEAARRAVDNTTKRTREEVWADDFAKAKAELQMMSPAQARNYLVTLPVAILEMYLLAEEALENRSMVLDFFPKPGATARARYLTPKVPAAKKRRSRKKPATTEE